MGALAKLKRDLTQHRGKAVVLGILFAAMVTMSMRAFLELRPKAAVAALPTADAVKSPLSTGSGAQADEQMRESQELWKRLKEVKASATGAHAAFTFDPASYPPPLVTEVKPVAAPLEFTPAPPVPTVMSDDRTAQANRVREQARALVVKSTAVGNGTMEPMAIVNQQLMTVGQKILGFEVSAIRAREVVFVKDGVTTVVRMPEGQ
jgi:hypothetical protein